MRALPRLIIVGAGGHGREAMDIALAMNSVEPHFKILGFADDGREPGLPATPHDARVVCAVDEVTDLDASVVLAIGKPEARRLIVERLGDVEYVDLVHPQASIGSHVLHGPGLIMAAGSRMTHAVELGRHVHLNVDASINHDCRVGNFVTITPGARLSGAVTIGDDVWLGVNSSVIQNVTIGDRVTVGAGAAVIEDLPSDCTAVGVPARPRRGGK